MTSLEQKLTNIAYYFEGIQPLSEDDGFNECLYSEVMKFDNYVNFTFYLDDYVSDKNYELFIEFLENNGFINSKIKYSFNQIEITIEIDIKKINTLSNKAELYLKTKKYNL